MTGNVLELNRSGILTYRNFFILTFLILFCLVFHSSCFAMMDDDSTFYINQKKEIKHTINRALEFSLIPGLGQIRNHQYLTIPVFYSAFGLLGKMAYDYNTKVNQSKRAYFNIFNKQFPLSYNNFEDKNAYLKAFGQHPPYSFEFYRDSINRFKNTGILSPTDSIYNQLQKYRIYRNCIVIGIGVVYLFNLADGIRPFYNEIHVPYKATVYSAIFPGLGQIYNHEYWKLPLIAVGFETFGYFIKTNNLNYKRYLHALLIRKDVYAMKNSKDWIANDPSYTDDILTNFKEKYKRWRDMNILGAAAFYVLNIIDATVFAYLKDYDVSDDLTLDLKPSYYISPNKNAAFGMSLTINL